MNNIFENAYFGKPYKTRDDKKAIFLGLKNPYEVFMLYNVSMTNYPILDARKVRAYDGKIYTTLESGGDIVSEWQEEINEEELDKLADSETYKKSEEFDNCLDDILSLLDGENQLKLIFKKCLMWAFKAGYRKAKEE